MRIFSGEWRKGYKLFPEQILAFVANASSATRLEVSYYFSAIQNVVM